MKRLSLLVAVCLALSLGACDKVEEAFKASFDEGFRKTFRASFMKHCVGNVDTKAQYEICTCVVQDLLTTYSTEQLKDTDMIQTYIESEALPACKESEG